MTTWTLNPNILWPILEGVVASIKVIVPTAVIIFTILMVIDLIKAIVYKYSDNYDEREDD